MFDQEPMECAFHDTTGICGSTLVVIVAVAAMVLGLVIPGVALLFGVTLHKLSAL